MQKTHAEIGRGNSVKTLLTFLQVVKNSIREMWALEYEIADIQVCFTKLLRFRFKTIFNGIAYQT
jgi:hypothetical protein